MSEQPNIIIVGASARAAAFSALRAGMRPYAIDLFADCDLADACPAVKIEHYPQDFEQALAAAPQAPWIYTGGLENYPDLISRMEPLRPLYGNRADVLGRIRSPELLATRLATAGFIMLEIRSSPPEAGLEGQWLRKPRRSSAGLGIRWLDAAINLADEPRYYYQRHIPGSSRSAVYFARQGACGLLGVTDQQSGVPNLSEEPFLYAGSAVFQTNSAEAKSLGKLGEVLTREFNLRGLFNVDYVDDGRQIWPLEVNPRYSASMEVLEYSRGQKFLALHAAEFNPSLHYVRAFSISSLPRHVAKRIVYAARECIVSPSLHELRKAWNQESRLPCLADIPRSGDRILRGQPVATVIGAGASDDEVQCLLQERVKSVELTLTPT
ncbi:MAG: ATP-grasp domain-containing protein [Pirellulaceae bacterium]|nr:ATP-grasp domain-containing protein [Pirellulaceae bacterium]